MIINKIPKLANGSGLPYFNPEEVSGAFGEWIGHMPEGNEATKKFSEYVHDYYIREGVQWPPKMWASKTTAINLTTNACEGFYSGFKRNFNSPHPNIHVFTEQLVLYQCDIYAKLDSIASANQQCH